LVSQMLVSDDAALWQLLWWFNYCVQHKPTPVVPLSMPELAFCWLLGPYEASSCCSSAALAARAAPRGKRGNW
jgi:hypothetical protein